MSTTLMVTGTFMRRASSSTNSASLFDISSTFIDFIILPDLIRSSPGELFTTQQGGVSHRGPRPQQSRLTFPSLPIGSQVPPESFAGRYSTPPEPGHPIRSRSRYL